MVAFRKLMELSWLLFALMGLGLKVKADSNTRYVLTGTKTNSPVCKNSKGEVGYNSYKSASAFLTDFQLKGSSECADISKLNLSKPQRPRFERGELIGVYAVKTKMAGAFLGESFVDYSNFSGADLRGVDLVDSSGRNANFSGANLSPLDGEYSRLENTKFKGSNFSNANLTLANLAGINLSGASLNGAKLNGADLVRANLVNADLRGADLRGLIVKNPVTGEDEIRITDFSGATFGKLVKNPVTGEDEVQFIDPSGANLKDFKLTGAKFNENTALPWAGYDKSLPERIKLNEALGMVFVADPVVTK